jgi:D-sedoheptulose 7-phosphate isomerase
MNWQIKVRALLEESIAVQQHLLAQDNVLGQVESLAIRCNESLQRGGKVIFAGNGGSFAAAQHMAASFVSRFSFDRAPLAAIVLGANSSVITAVGNDYGYEQVFERELLAVAKQEDIFIPFSTSGDSTNIVMAVTRARELGLDTVAFTGQIGGQIKALCECVHIPSSVTARVQEGHLFLGHILCELIEEMYFAR